MIAKETIDKIYELDMTQVIGKYIDLKKTGANYKGLSPFTKENTPSFVVSPAKQIWKCYSSGAGGNNPISFVMQSQGLTYPDAIRDIADKCNVIVKYDNSEKSIEDLEKRKENFRIIEINEMAYSFFQSKIHECPEDKLRMSYARAEAHGLGFADNDFGSLFNFLLQKGVTKIQMEKAGLITTTDKGSFDFFNNRIIFPIWDINCKLVGFSGRRIDNEKEAKYLNTRETNVFSKSKSFLGIDHSINAIIKSKSATIVEGNFDVKSVFDWGINNVVAGAGTAFTTDHLRELKKRGVVSLLIIMDGDRAGRSAAMKLIPKVYQEHMAAEVFFLPEGEDPDSFFSGRNYIYPILEKKTGIWSQMSIWDVYKYSKDDKRKFIKEYQVDAGLTYGRFLFEETDTVAAKAAAEADLEKFLATIEDEKIRRRYIDELSGEFNLSKTDLKTNIKLVIKTYKELAGEDEDSYRFPRQLTQEEKKQYYQEVKEFGFYEDESKYKMGYWFLQSQSKSFEQCSNFLVKPLFHIFSVTNNRRLVEIKNKDKSQIIEVSSKGFVNISGFTEEAINHMNAHWLGTPKQFKYIAMKFMEQMPTANEITTLGWQPEGFFAFADGISENGSFKAVDSYGIITDNNSGENYFLPAFSSINRHLRIDNDIYESDRVLKYRPSKLTFEVWSKKYYKVFSENGAFCLAFLIATTFRDLIQSKNPTSSFPILWGFGDIQTGKSKAAEAINAVLQGETKPFNLSVASPAAFARKLSQYRNAVVWLDEYSNDIDEKIFQGIKGSWEGIGRDKGKATHDNKTSRDKVLCGLFITGQYSPTRDSNSNYSRAIILPFGVKSSQRTDEETRNFNELVQIQRAGLSNILLEILPLRDLIEEKFEQTYNEIYMELKSYFKQKDIKYDGRVLGNYTVLAATVKLTSEVLRFPFTYAKFLQLSMKFIEKQSAEIMDSDVLQGYWKIVEYLWLQGEIKSHVDFEIQYRTSCRLYINSKESQEIDFGEKKTLLFIQFKRIHPLYMEAYKRQNGIPGINQNSIRQYMKSADEFVGITPSHQFEEFRTSAWVFDYDKLREGGLALQVSPEISKTNKKEEGKKGHKDLPF